MMLARWDSPFASTRRNPAHLAVAVKCARGKEAKCLNVHVVGHGQSSVSGFDNMPLSISVHRIPVLSCAKIYKLSKTEVDDNSKLKDDKSRPHNIAEK